eukprot:4838590-Pyramimonas_sp.AAC.1
MREGPEDTRTPCRWARWRISLVRREVSQGALAHSMPFVIVFFGLSPDELQLQSALSAPRRAAFNTRATRKIRLNIISYAHWGQQGVSFGQARASSNVRGFTPGFAAVGFPMRRFDETCSPCAPARTRRCQLIAGVPVRRSHGNTAYSTTAR